MSIGTFGSFTQARLAIYAAQSGITVSGNNISNINTPGYTRQRLDQSSLYTTGADRYYSQGDVRIGQGVLVRSLSQIRSPYLDIRYRTETAKVGYNDAVLDGLNQIASILDEVGKGDDTKGEADFGVLGLEFSKIFDALGQLTDQTGHQEYDSTVKQTCANLATLFNRYANSLQEVYDVTVTKLHEDVDKVNGLLTSIRNYNEEIRKCDIHGDNALELRDERNLAIDELSQLIGIRVHYSMEEFSPGVEVEKLSIYLDDKNPDGAVDTDSSLLVDGIYSAQLILEQVPQTQTVDPTNQSTWPYQDADGNPVINAADANQVPVKNPNYKDTETDTSSPAYGEFLKPDGTGTNNEAEAKLGPEANVKYLPYVKPDGTLTKDPEEARMVDSPNFNITVSELRNSAGRLYYTTSVSPEEVLTDAGDIEAAKEALAKGGTVTKTEATGYPGIDDIIITTYREELLKNPPYMTERDKDGRPAGQPTFANTGIPNPSYYEYVKEENGYFVYSSTKLPGMTDNDEFGGHYLTGPLPGGQACDAEHAARTYYKTVTTKEASVPVELDDNDLYGEIQGLRELLTEGGEFTDRDVITKDSSTGPYRNTDEGAGTKRGIVYFQRRLDLLANQFANILNEANQGYRTDPSGNYITYGTDDRGEPAGVPVTVTYTKDGASKTITLNKNTDWDSLDQEARDAMQLNDRSINSVKDYLERGGGKDGDGNNISMGIFDGGVLFSNNGSGNDTTGITAANISISYQWQNTEKLLVRSFTCPVDETEPASGDPENIRHIQDLVGGKSHDFVPSDLDYTGTTQNASDDIMFSGTFFAFWNDIGTVLGEDREMTGVDLDSAYERALAIDTSRDSVSAVDFNDEAMNLMMYAKSYNAACRLMTVIDSVLDKLVNNTGVTT